MLPAILALCIPLVAIIGGYYVKIKQMNLDKNGGSGGIDFKDKQQFNQILKENQDLRKRIENLEGIVTSLDKEFITIRPVNDTEEITKQIEALAKKLKQ
jgi:cell division protein FtsB